MPMSDVALFTVAQMRKQPKCTLMGGWIKKMWYVHTMEYYVALRKGTVQYGTAYMNLEDTASHRKRNNARVHFREVSK